MITALVNALTKANATPAVSVGANVANLQTYLEPQPDDDVVRFAFEDHCQALTGPDRDWPESTKHISQLRVTLEWESDTGAWGLFSLKRRLHVDIVDYPGEWLLDLALMDQSFAQWSAQTIQTLKRRHKNSATDFFKFLESLPETVATRPSEQTAIDGAKIFTDCLQNVRSGANTQAVLGPGRFLWPGDLAGSPQVTFFPWPTQKTGDVQNANLQDLLERRFEAYKTNIVKPFFTDQFSRLDRQIVLVDALTPLNRGAQALTDLEEALQNVLSAFRPGSNSWLSLFTGRRIDKILFAATKADHVHSKEHGQLENILDKIISRVSRNADQTGAQTKTLALASVRATGDVNTQTDGELYHCIRGVPTKGETIQGKSYDGETEAIIFPGDLPENALDVFDPDYTGRDDYEFVRFRPPLLSALDETGQTTLPPWPHIGLDKAIGFLIGDRLK